LAGMSASDPAAATAATPAASRRPAYRPLLGILFMCTASSLFPVMNGIAKLMSQSFSSEQVVWARTLSHLIFVLALFVPRHGWQIVRTKRPGVQFFRSCMLISSTFLFFSAIKFIPIAQAASISFMTPLLVVVLAGPMLGEKITLARVIPVVIGFLGVLVVIRPGADVFQWASLLIVANAGCYAMYQVLTKRVAGHDRPETSSVYSALLGSILMSLIVPFSWKTPAALSDVLLLSSLGVLGGAGHYCIARAMTYAPANFLSPFQYWQLVGSVAVGYFMFAEMPDAFTWVGAALIIGAGLYIGLRGEDRPAQR
ncbi:MAG TPA: DMT family transporter, partial [Quisquiliibacterium sp.]|nr:DMT family transporter [Quisquiliibacterium sp.]